MSDTVTIVFTDLVGSTALASQLGDDANDEVRRRHFAALADAVATTRGELVKNLGDGIMAAYASAADAVAGAIALQQAVDRENRSRRVSLAIRIGVSSGDAGREDGDWFGAPVVEAARLCADAEGGQILANDVVRVLAGSRGGHAFRRLGPRSLRGIADPVEACEVVWAAAGGDAVPIPPPLAASESVPLVGRDGALADLVDRLTKVTAGARTAVFLGGEPGIGKTRLAAEFAKVAHAAGALVLFGRCDEEPLSPYQPFLEALGYYVRNCSTTDLRAATGRHAPVLARLLPDVGDRLPGLPSAPSSDPDSDRFRLFEGVTALLRSLSDERPLVLVLDDLHWADKPTLLLLRHVLRHPDPIRMLVVGTYRDTELGRAHPLSETFADLRRDGFDDRVALRGLNEDDIEALVVGVAGRDLDDQAMSLVHVLHEVTEGSPFFLREVLRHLIEVGVLRQTEGRWTVERLITRAGLPEGVKEVVGRRLSRLSDATNDVLRAASVIGREFEVPVLARVTAAADDAVLDALDEAMRARIVIEVSGIDRFAFSHALVREALHDELSTARRIRLHQRVGKALEDLHVGDLDTHLSQLAYHYAEAAGGVPASVAIDYCRRAATYALSLYAYEEAVNHLRSALEILSGDEISDYELHVDLLLELGDAERQAAGSAAGTATFERALELARSRQDARRIGGAVMGITGWYSYPGRRDHVAEALLEEALAICGDEHLALRAWLTARLSLSLYYGGSVARSRELAAAALDLARRAGDQRTLAYVLWTWRWHLMISTDLDERARIADEMETAARAAGDGWLVGSSYAWRVSDKFAAGDIAATRQAMTEYHALVEQARLAESRYYVTLFDGALAMSEGRLDEAEVIIHDALALGQELGDPIVMNQYAAQLYALRMEQDRLDELLPIVEMMAESEPEIPWAASAALVLAWNGDHERARERLRAVVVDDLRAIPADGNWPVFICVLSWAAGVIDDAESAAVLYPHMKVYEHVRITVGVFCGALALGALGLAMLEVAMERYDDAERHLLASMASDEAVESPVWSARTACVLAQLYLRRNQPGDHERAIACAERARADANVAGAVATLRFVDELGI